MEGQCLYNPQLDTFITAAEAGSFSKAAEIGHITPTAVIKQINALEASLGFPLFIRTHRGIILTEGGTSLYKDAVYLIRYCRDSAMRAQEARKAALIRVGTSPVTPGTFLMKLWPTVKRMAPELSIQLVPFDNTPEHAREILTRLGERIDVVAGPYDEATLKRWGISAVCLRNLPLRLAVPLRHRLALRKELTWDDLSGETVMMIHTGWNASMDRLRKDLEKRHISIADFDFYRTDIFNRCEQENCLLAAIDTWEDVHPLLKIMPVRWAHTIPYGILHHSRPAPSVRRFLSAVEGALEDKQP